MGVAPPSTGLNLIDQNPATAPASKWCTLSVTLPNIVKLKPKGIPGNYKLNCTTFINAVQKQPYDINVTILEEPIYSLFDLVVGVN